MLPSSISAGRAAFANGVRFSNWRETAEALWASVAISGVPWSASLPRSTTSGRSWRRNDGNSWNVREMSVARAALATEVVFAWTTKSDSWFLAFASGASTASESVASCASTLFWWARIWSTLSVCPSAGLARWIDRVQVRPAAARPVPSSSRISAKRCRIGSCEMSWTMSESTGELVWASGSRYAPLPGPLVIFCSGGADRDPGWQSTYFSPISDCGRIAQWALA